MNQNYNNRLAIWKQSDTEYTVKTSANLWYQVTIFKAETPQAITHKRIYAGEGYQAAGELLKAIPAHLKFYIFSLQRAQ
jgi:hypothetical protein